MNNRSRLRDPAINSVDRVKAVARAEAPVEVETVVSPISVSPDKHRQLKSIQNQFFQLTEFTSLQLLYEVFVKALYRSAASLSI